MGADWLVGGPGRQRNPAQARQLDKEKRWLLNAELRGRLGGSVG